MKVINVGDYTLFIVSSTLYMYNYFYWIHSFHLKDKIKAQLFQYFFFTVIRKETRQVFLLAKKSLRYDSPLGQFKSRKAHSGVLITFQIISSICFSHSDLDNIPFLQIQNRHSRGDWCQPMLHLSPCHFLQPLWNCGICRKKSQLYETRKVRCPEP